MHGHVTLLPFLIMRSCQALIVLRHAKLKVIPKLTWTDGVASNIVLDIVNRNGLSEPQHCCLGCSIYTPIGCSLDAWGNWCYVDDISWHFLLPPEANTGLASVEYALHIDIKAPVPVLLLSILQGPMKHKAN